MAWLTLRNQFGSARLKQTKGCVNVLRIVVSCPVRKLGAAT